MINLKIGTSTERKDIIADPNTPIVQLLDEADIIYAEAQVSLNGIPLTFTEMQQSLSQLGITEDKAILIVTMKTSNGN